MANPLALAGQVLVYAGFFACVGYLTSAPDYTYLDPGLAQLRVSFTHAGERREPCRRYTPEEIAATAPNMRRALDCARERVALRLEIDLDGATVIAESLAPTGVASDGAAAAYARLPLTPGPHRLVARLRDTRRAEGFDHEAVFDLEVTPGDNVVLDFRPQTGGFRLL